MTRDVPPYSIVGRNPATVIRGRFDEVLTDQLLALAWWDWLTEKITRYAALLTGNVTEFLQQVRHHQH